MAYLCLDTLCWDGRVGVDVINMSRHIEKSPTDFIIGFSFGCCCETGPVGHGLFFINKGAYQSVSLKYFQYIKRYFSFFAIFLKEIIKNSFIIRFGFYKTFTIIVSNENNRLLSLKSNFFVSLTRMTSFLMDCYSSQMKWERENGGAVFDRSSGVKEGL